MVTHLCIIVRCSGRTLFDSSASPDFSYSAVHKYVSMVTRDCRRYRYRTTRTWTTYLSICYRIDYCTSAYGTVQYCSTCRATNNHINLGRICEMQYSTISHLEVSQELSTVFRYQRIATLHNRSTRCFPVAPDPQSVNVGVITFCLRNSIS
jgi:hypothetical protein